jgi:hypothetical protein
MGKRLRIEIRASRDPMDLVRLTSSFAEIVSDFLHYLPASSFVALAKRQ